MTPSPSADDAKLFRRARRDPDAFAELYQAYVSAVYAWFRRHISADPETAADLTAEVFARALLGIRRFRGSRPDSGTAWLFVIVRNLGADFSRSQAVEDRARRKLGLAEKDYQPSPEEDTAIRLDAEMAGDSIMKAFESLSADQQAALVARVIEERDYRDIGQTRGTSEQAVRLQVMRGLRRLRELVSSPHPEGGA